MTQPREDWEELLNYVADKFPGEKVMIFVVRNEGESHEVFSNFSDPKEILDSILSIGDSFAFALMYNDYKQKLGMPEPPE